VLQALLVLIKNPVPVIGRKLLVVGITSNFEDMKMLGLASVFDVCMEVPMLSERDQFDSVLAGSKVPMNEEERSKVVDIMMQQPIGIKKLLMIAEMARQDMVSGEEETMITCKRFVDCVYKFRL